MPPGGGDVHTGVHKRATWLNANVFGGEAINKDAIALLSTCSWERATELLKQVEEKKSEMKNPSGYLIMAVKRDLGGGGAGSGGSGQGLRGGSADGGDVYNGVHKRATWLNANVFGGEAINQDAVAALASCSWERAMELLKQVEEKKSEMKNASGYIVMAVKRDLGGGGAQSAVQGWGGGSASSGGVYNGVHKRATWLNANVFSGEAINQDAIETLSSCSWERATELLKQVEEKKSEMKNPSGYLIMAVKRDLSGGGRGAQSAAQGWGGGGGSANSGDVYNGVHKRATWLNANVFGGEAINQDAIAALSSGAWDRAMELLKQVEEQKSEIKNPSGYLIMAAKRDLGGGGRGAQGVGRSFGGDVVDGVHKRCTWLNANVFGGEAITHDAIAALSGLPWDRAMELLKQVEEKKSEMKNASGYLITAAKRDLEGAGGLGVKRERSEQGFVSLVPQLAKKFRQS